MNKFLTYIFLTLLCFYSNVTASNIIKESNREAIVIDNQNFCTVLNEIFKVSESQNLNSAKNLGPFQLHVLKDGRPSNWGMYKLSKSILVTPGKIVVYLDGGVASEMILSPNARHHFKNDLILNANCINNLNIKYVNTELKNNQDYIYVHVFSINLNTKKVVMRFFSNIEFKGNDLSFNRLTLKID